MSVHDRNKAKIEELRPEVRWAARYWINDCWDAGLRVVITEAYRSPERQKELYAQGRTKPGKIITWTLYSRHMDRLAVDIVEEGGGMSHAFLAKAAEIGKRYGVTWPLAKAPHHDYLHYEFTEVEPIHLNLSAEARQKRTEIALRRAEARFKPPILQRVIARILRRI